MTSMIKGIIQKIIMTTFGKFIKGIQKDKLSVDLFSGNFKLQNISLNHQFFDSLNTPFSIVYSSIGKLSLQAPLSKLSSVPVQCILDNIFVVIQFKQNNNDHDKSFQFRKDNLLKEVKQVLESTLKRIKQQKKQDGMMSKLGKKILDNLIMKIKNVHLRFQQRNVNKGYAFGLTLESISLNTTDNQWKPSFVQRKADSQEQLFKMMQVSKLNLYWDSQTQNSTMIMSKDLSAQERKTRLSQLIQEDRELLISITSQFKLTINPQQALESPLYSLNIALEPIKFQLKRLQMHQMMSFAKKNIIQNQNIIKSMSKKSKIKLSQQEKGRLRQQYEDIISSFLSNYQENGQLTNEISINQTQLQQIFDKIQENQLKVWSLGPIKKKAQVVRQIQIKKKKGGWFTRGNVQLTEQQQQQLKVFIDQSFENNRINDIRPSSCIFFRVNLQLKSSQILLIENKGTDIEEVIQFNVGKIQTQISKSQDTSYFYSQMDIQSINLNLYLSVQKQNHTKKKKMQIFTSQKPAQYKQQSDEDSMQSFQSLQQEQRPSFFKIKYKNELFKQKAILKKTINGNIQRLTVIYKKIYMQKFRKFFSFKQKQTFIKKNLELNEKIQNKLDHLEKQEEAEQEEFKLQKQTDIKLTMNSPVFICPLNENQCWCLNLGRLKIISNRSEKVHQYPMIIQSAFLRYYPFMKECFDLKSKKEGKGIFSLINDMDFKVNYQKFKVSKQQVLSVELPSFKVNFTQKQYKNLISFTKIFTVEQDEKRNMVQILKEERRIIDQNKTYESQIMKKNETLMSWRQFHGIISGSYLYLYDNMQKLKQSSKIYLKNAKILLKTNQVDEDSYELEITNQNQICYLSCHETAQVLKWKIQLQNKCSSFKTIHEMMKQYEQSQIRSGRKRGSSENMNYQTNFKRKKLKFQISQVGFRYENQQQDSLLQFQIKGINFSKQNMKNWSQKQFSLEKLTITDRIFKFKNPCYQTLIQATKVSFQDLKGKKNKEGTREANITINIQDLYINWKPDVLLMLIKLANQHFHRQQNYRLDDDIEQSRQEHFKQTYSDSKFMFFKNNYDSKSKNIRVKENRDQLSLKASWMKEIMRVNINFKKFSINLIHRESHLVMIKLISNDMGCNLTITQTAKFVNGYVNQLEIYDMTGYPKKEYSINEQNQPYIIMKKKADNKDSLIHFRWSSYDPSSFPNQQNVDSFIWVQITPLEYEYYQQITFRMIDYFLIQIILLITQPEMLTVNQNLMQQLKNQQVIKGQKPVKILFSRYDEIIKKLIHPFFMDIYCNIKDISLILKAEKSSHIFYDTTIKNLLIYNITKKHHKRFSKVDQEQRLKEFIYEEQYIIKGEDCHFSQISINNGRREELFQPFRLEINFNKLLFEDEINILFPEVEDYDRSFLTVNNISNIIISHYSRLQYLNLNKLVNFNFTFDDENDQMFIHNFKITKLLSPKPLLYHLVVPEVHMTADYNAREQSNDIWKLFKATIHKFTFIYRRNKFLNSSMQISLGLTQFKGFQYEQNKTEPNQIYLLTLGQFDKNSTQIVIQNKTSGQKLIQMSINQLQINIRSGLLQLIFEYTLIEDWVFPTINKITPQLIFHANVHKMNATLSENPKYMAKQLRKKNISNKVIESILNQKSNLASFRLEGLVCYKFYRKKDLTIQEYEKKFANKQMNFDDFQKKQDQMSSMKLIMNTQVYRGWTNAQSKRKIIQKFSFHMQDKRFLRVADLNKHTIKTIAKRTMTIDRCFMKISFKDVILMQNILNQINEQRKYIGYLNEKTGKSINQGNNDKQTELSSLQNLQINVEAISFYLINSRRQIFIPILKINMTSLNMTKTVTYRKDILKSDFILTVFYFNSKIFKWQPILETVSLGFHKIIYFGQNHSTFGSFQSLGPLLINISREVLMSLKETSDSWKRQSQQQQKKFIIRQSQIQPLEFISHYVIRNEIGYPIQILNNKLQILKKINHNDQTYYELQMSNYQQQIDFIQIFVGFRIIHPKYQFSEISNISFNSQKEYHFEPRIKGKGNKAIINNHSKIIIKPQVINNKKVLMIKSCKYVYNYFDGKCQITALPFDHDIYYTLPKPIHNEMKVSLYESKSTQHYRYIGKDGILKIMQKHLVYNYSPIPLQICGKMVQPNEYIGISQRLRIQDQNYKDSLMKVIKNQKMNEYYIFSQCYVIDYYGLYFQFEKDNKDINKLYSFKYFNENESPYFLYLLPDSQFKFKVRTKNHQNCKSASLKTTIGKTNFVLQDQGKAQCHFVLNSYLKALENSHINQFIRVIEITPKYMLSNATKTLIKICQVESCDSITLNPYERVPFFWENKKKARYIKISSYDGQDFWGYSGQLSIQKSTETIVLRKSSDPKLYKIFTLQMQVTNTVNFLHIIEPSPKYVLSNKIPGTIMQVYQKAILDQKLDLQYSFPVEFFFLVRYDQQKPFGYELPQQNRTLRVKIGFEKDNKEYQGLNCDQIDVSEIQTNLWVKQIAIRDESKKICHRIYISLKFQNNIKKLMIHQYIEEEQIQNTYQFIVKIPSFGLSFVGFHDQIRKQIVHIILDDIEVQFFGNSDSNDIDLRVSKCRIQNQLKYNAFFPVLFQSLQKQSKKFIHFKVSRSAKNSRLIYYIGCSINRSQFNITSQELQVIQENISMIKLHDQQQTRQMVIRKCQMFNSTLPDPQESIYFVEAVIYPLKVVVTFKHVNQWGGKLLKTLSSLNQCPLSTQGIQLRHFTCLNFGVFLKLLLKHYQDGLSKMVLSMIGNLTILGSPVTLVTKIGSGFKDLVELPVNQFENGPLQVGKGAIRGTASLVSNTISGAFNTVQSITGSIGNGISVLVDGDRSFVKDRENIKNEKSEHVIGGLANGAKSIAYGLKNGLSGVFTEPVKGAQKHGLPGFFLGVGKGLGGLIVKPISGVLDAASKTAQGIKNTPQFFNTQKQQRYIRLHNPRPFYNYNKEFRNYDKQFASLIKIIYQYNKQRYDNLSWCSYYCLVNKNQKSRAILLLSYEYIFFYDVKRSKMLNIIESSCLTGVSLKEQQGQGTIRLNLVESKTMKQGSIVLVPDGGCRKLASEVGTIIRHYSPNFKFG